MMRIVNNSTPLVDTSESYLWIATNYIYNYDIMARKVKRNKSVMTMGYKSKGEEYYINIKWLDEYLPNEFTILLSLSKLINTYTGIKRQEFVKKIIKNKTQIRLHNCKNLEHIYNQFQDAGIKI